VDQKYLPKATGFRDEGEHRFRDEAERFQADPGMVFGFAGMISTGSSGAGQHNGRQPPLEREDQLASQEIVRAQDQRSS
jgi:hypothetical protein